MITAYCISTGIPLLNILGWLTGFEPATTRSTILYSNQLSYSHHILVINNKILVYDLSLTTYDF